MPVPPASPPLRQLGEFGLIARIRRRMGRPGSAVLRGIGDDDAAVVRLDAKRLLLVTTDLLVEGVHFSLATVTPADIGYKAAVSNLSDIAAMGGTPDYMVVALAIPASWRVSALDDLYRGLRQACRPHRVELVGGDTSTSRHGLFVCITLTGRGQKNRLLTRSGAHVGDSLYVTGTLGDSLAGLRILEHGAKPRRRRAPTGKTPDLRFLVRRHVHPTARLTEGQLLAKGGLATAALDVSDGLSGDLRHLCRLSGVGVEVETARLPLSRACRWYAAQQRLDPFDLALTGGEDYELLFTVAPSNQEKVARLARRIGTRMTRIGTIRPRAFGINVRPGDGRLRPLPVLSYDHFRRTGGTTHKTGIS